MPSIKKCWRSPSYQEYGNAFLLVSYTAFFLSGFWNNTVLGEDRPTMMKLCQLVRAQWYVGLHSHIRNPTTRCVRNGVCIYKPLCDIFKIMFIVPTRRLRKRSNSIVYPDVHKHVRNYQLIK